MKKSINHFLSFAAALAFADMPPSNTVWTPPRQYTPEDLERIDQIKADSRSRMEAKQARRAAQMAKVKRA
jgi:hypothetical protein